MAKIDKSNLSYLGINYQVRLIAQILTDRQFGDSIIDIINPLYFDDEYLRIVVVAIKNAKGSHEVIPDMQSLEARLLSDAKDDINRKYALSQFRKIQEADLNDTLWVQDTAMKFCKQQELIKSLELINKIVTKGDIENYEECVNILRKALDHGDAKDDGMDIMSNIEHVLEDDFRKPIRTGIHGLDEIMDGGLSKGELAVILAPFGVGKTTMITKIANTAMTDGYKVLQIFFEDNPKVIQRKHLSCWSKIGLNDLGQKKVEVMSIVDNIINNSKGILKLKKFSSDGTTIPIIRQYIRKLIAQGFKPDIILLDYIDCVEPSRKFDDVNAGEGSVMRQFETMLSELDIAGWTAVQGNRCIFCKEKITIEGKGDIEIGDVELGDKILTHEGYKEVSYVFPKEKQPVYKIKTKSGKEIMVSKKHLFPTGDYGMKSIEMGLNVGDKLLIKK